MKTIFGFGLMSIQFFIPVLVLIICYGKIVWVLTRRINTDLMKDKTAMDNSDRGKDTDTRSTKGKFQLARKNTIKTVLIIGLCFIICWSQNQVIYFMYNCGYDLKFNSTYFNFTILMVFVNCTVNPFIYLITYKDYQEALKILFQCAINHQSDNSLNSSAMSFSHSTTVTWT